MNVLIDIGIGLCVLAAVPAMIGSAVFALIAWVRPIPHEITIRVPAQPDAR